jgi:transcriptional regulator with XRE-family HTH domain
MYKDNQFINNLLTFCGDTKVITPTQMRAARAMLDVSQGHVAEFLGIAANTLSKIESGQSDVSVSRNADIQRFYEREGIAFTENDGVKRRSGGVEIYKNRSGFLDFMDDVYETVKNGGDIYVDNVDESQFLKWGGDDVPRHVTRMESIDGICSKILVEEGCSNVVASDYAEYREVSKDLFGSMPLYIYADKTALIVFDKEEIEIYVIDQAEVTKYFRDRFILKWNTAKVGTN